MAHGKPTPATAIVILGAFTSEAECPVCQKITSFTVSRSGVLALR